MVHSVILNLIKSEYDLYNSVGGVTLSVRGCDLDTWLEEMNSSECVPDELMLYALSRAYNRHTAVICRDRIWTTVEITEMMTCEDLLNACHVHLVYVDSSVFAELKPLPPKSSVLKPITMEQLSYALMQIKGKGKGRPCSKPLNLTKKSKKHSKQTVTISSGSQFTQPADVDTEPLPLQVEDNIPVTYTEIQQEIGPIVFPEPIETAIVPLNASELNKSEKCELQNALHNIDSQSKTNNSNQLATEQREETDTNMNAGTPIVNTTETTALGSEPHVSLSSNSQDTETPVNKLITWTVGTGLIYVMYDQIQGELMAMEDYLKITQTDSK